jgi:hypothetical protein
MPLRILDPFISPDSFSGTQAIPLMTMLIVGGVGSIAGCVVGAVALTILPEVLRFLGQWYQALWPRRNRRDRHGAGRSGPLVSLHSDAGRTQVDLGTDHCRARRDAAVWPGRSIIDPTCRAALCSHHRPQWFRETTLLGAERRLARRCRFTCIGGHEIFRLKPHRTRGGWPNIPDHQDL